MSVPIPASRRAALRRRLLAWYDAGHRKLPWRFPQGEADPYRVWLAEVMLQQTQIATVIPYYHRFLARYPTLEALAPARDEEVFALWSGLGYYARCRNMLSAAREALRRHGGLPGSIEALAALPGFGPYTAGAVASIAFGLPAPAVDGNAARVLARLFALRGDLAEPGARRALQHLAAALVPREGGRPGDFNQALMDLGATLCARRSPSCGRCPVAALCLARERGLQEELPRARRRRARTRMLVACALVERDDAVLLVRETGAGLFSGLWQLPGTVVAPDERPRPALRAMLATRLGLAVQVGPRAAEVQRTLTHRDLTLRAFRCSLANEPWPSGRAALRWQPWNGLPGGGMPTAMRALLDAVRAGREAARSVESRTRPRGKPTEGPNLGRAARMRCKSP